MRKHLLFAFLAAISATVAAQQQPKDRQPQKDQQQEATEKKDPAEERTRVEGAAGGTTPVPEQKRKAVGAGAGPHLHDELPSPAKLPRDRPVQPPK